MKTSWSNKSQHKYSIQLTKRLFRSQNSIFKCNTYININNDNMPINLLKL